MRSLLRHQAGAIAATAVDFSVMIGSVALAGLSPASATALGAASGGTANFVLGRRWIFRAGQGAVGGQIGRYALVSLASLLLNTAGEHLLAGAAHVQYIFARVVVALAVSVLWNFPMQRSFVFRAVPSDLAGKTARSAVAIPDRWLSSECVQAALGEPPGGVGIPVLNRVWMDRFLARAHPAFPLVLYGPATLLVLAAAHRPGSALRHGVAFCAGWLVWSLAEYLLHRFLFHRTPTPTRASQIAAFLIHGYHHAYPRDPTRLVLPPLASLPLAFAFLVTAHFVLGGGAVDAGFAGFLAGYIVYDSMHYVVHHTRTKTGVIGWLRRYHLLHHHEHVRARYGVSSPLWDLLLGTFRDTRAPSRRGAS